MACSQFVDVPPSFGTNCHQPSFSPVGYVDLNCRNATVFQLPTNGFASAIPTIHNATELLLGAPIKTEDSVLLESALKTPPSRKVFRCLIDPSCRMEFPRAEHLARHERYLFDHIAQVKPYSTTSDTYVISFDHVESTQNSSLSSATVRSASAAWTIGSKHSICLFSSRIRLLTDSLSHFLGSIKKLRTRTWKRKTLRHRFGLSGSTILSNPESGLAKRRPRRALERVPLAQPSGKTRRLRLQRLGFFQYQLGPPQPNKAAPR